MMIRIWLMAMLAMAIAAMCGVKYSGVTLVVVFIVGESRLPAPEGEQKYP